MKHILSKQQKNTTAGFTIVEMIVVISVMLVIIFFIYNTLWSMFTSSTADSEQLNMIYDRQNAMSIIESDVALTSRYLDTLDSGLTDPYPPSFNSGVWTYKGNSSTSRVLILRNYSTTGNPLSLNATPVFMGTGSSCLPTTIYFNTVLRYDTIYFVNNGNLYRRRIVDPSTPTCTSQYQKTSCPSLVDLGVSSRDTRCGADDELILKNVTNFTVNYYALKSDTTPQDVYGSGATPAMITSAIDAEVTIATSKKAFGKVLNTQYTLRLSKINQDL